MVTAGACCIQVSATCVQCPCSFFCTNFKCQNLNIIINYDSVTIFFNSNSTSVVALLVCTNSISANIATSNNYNLVTCFKCVNISYKCPCWSCISNYFSATFACTIVCGVTKSFTISCSTNCTFCRFCASCFCVRTLVSSNNCERCSLGNLFCSIVRTKSTNYFNNISNVCIICCKVNKNGFSFFIFNIEITLVISIVACYCTSKFN